MPLPHPPRAKFVQERKAQQRNATYSLRTAFIYEHHTCVRGPLSHPSMHFSTVTPPSLSKTSIFIARVLRVGSVESHFTKHTRPSEVPLPHKHQNVKGICLPVASHQSPHAHALNNGRGRPEWKTISVKSKTIRAATELINVANAFGLAIRVRKFRCTFSRGIPTN